MKAPIVRFGRLFLLVTFSALPLRAAEDYPIRTSYQAKVGQKYALFGDSQNLYSTEWWAGSEIIRRASQREKVNFHGLVEVLEVDDAGKEVKLSITVRHFTLNRDDEVGRDALLPSGIVITAERKEKETLFSAKDLEIAPGTSKALKWFVNLSAEDDDEMFGKNRRKTGDVWPADAEALVKTMAQSGWNFEPGDVEGTCQLRRAGAKELGLAAKINIKNVKTRAPSEVKTPKLLEGTVKLILDRAVPIDPATVSGGTRLSESTICTYELKGEQFTSEGSRIEVRDLSA